MNEILRLYGLPVLTDCVAGLDSAIHDTVKRYGSGASNFPHNIGIQPKGLSYGTIGPRDFNAAAFSFNRKHYVVIDAMVYTITPALQWVLFANKNYLSFLGDSNGECALVRMPGSIGDIGRIIVNCRIRRKFASYARSVALSFILFHEMAHIFRGHVGCLSKEFKLSCMSERMSFSGRSLSNLELRIAQEYDADRFAAIMTTSLVIRKNPDFIDLWSANAGKSQLGRFLSSAINSVLLYLHPPDIDYALSTGYPTIWVRSFLVSHTIDDILEKTEYKSKICDGIYVKYKEDFDIFYKVLGRRFFAAIDRKFFPRILELTGVDLAIKKYDDHPNQHQQEMALAVQSYCENLWEEFREIHVPHAFVELLPLEPA